MRIRLQLRRMNGELLQLRRKLRLRILIWRKRRLLPWREQMIPYDVYDTLHIIRPACQSQNGVLLRHHDTELTKRAITAVQAMPTSPELVAIALGPIIGSTVPIGYLLGRSFINPL